MNEPLVSVVIPTYNHAEYIREAIDSVLQQTYQHIELIVIDNYSEDQTKDIIESYQDPRIKYIRFRNNGIIAASRNHGIEHAVGKYVAFLDSDDVWLSHKLESQVEEMEKDSQRGLSFCRFRVISDSNAEDAKVMGPKVDVLPDSVYEKLIKANFVVSSSTLVSKAALEDVGVFDEHPELRCSEDFDLWLRLARKYKIAYVPSVGGLYRVHATNQSGDDLRLKRALAVIEKHEKNGWISGEKANQARASFYFQVGWVRIGQDAKLARSHIRNARRLDPKNIRMVIVCTLGFMLSYVPSLYRFLLDHRIDKKISRRTINPQNL